MSTGPSEPIKWKVPGPVIEFKLMCVSSTGDGFDAKDEHLRAAGYVPVTTIAEWKERAVRAECQLAGCGVAALDGSMEAEAAQGSYGWSAAYADVLKLRREVERFRSGLKCQDWVRTGWVDAIEFLRREERPTGMIETEIRRRFMLSPTDPLRLGASVPFSGCVECGNDFAEGYCPHKKALPPGVRTIRDAQRCIASWVVDTLGPAIASNAGERVLRFVEEAVELAQACAAKPETLHRLVDYVYGRPKGTYEQEVAGSLVTLLAVASALGADVELEFEIEQARIHRPEIMEKVRNRQKEKREALVAAPLAIKGE